MNVKQAKETAFVRMARKRPSALTKAAQLARWNDRRLEFGKKFAVLVCGEQGRQAFHLFTSEKEALFYFCRLAYASLNGTKVRDVHGEFVEILFARLYQVYCDDEASARDRIARGDALRLHDSGDPYAGRELIVPWLFRTVQ